MIVPEYRNLEEYRKLSDYNRAEAFKYLDELRDEGILMLPELMMLVPLSYVATYLSDFFGHNPWTSRELLGEWLYQQETPPRKTAEMPQRKDNSRVSFKFAGKAKDLWPLLKAMASGKTPKQKSCPECERPVAADSNVCFTCMAADYQSEYQGGD
jgi:hypothetical protein